MKHLKKCIEELAQYFLTLRSSLEDGDSSVALTYYLCLYAIPLLLGTSVGVLFGLLLQVLNPVTCCLLIGFFSAILAIWKFNSYLTEEEAILRYSTEDFEEEAAIDIIEGSTENS